MALCRTCLSGNDLEPIFVDINLCNQRTQELYVVTGVKIRYNDGYPQHMCKECLRIVKETLNLRQLSANSEKILIEKEIQTKSDTQASFINKNDIPISNVTIKSEEPAEDLININTSLEETNKYVPILKIEPQQKRPTEKVYIKSVGGNVLECGIKLENDESNCNSDDNVNTQNISHLKTIKRGRGRFNTTVDIKDVNQKVFLKKDGQIILMKFREGEDRLMALAMHPVPPEGPIQCRICYKLLQKQSFRGHAKRHFDEQPKGEDKIMSLAVVPYPPKGPIQCSVCKKVLLKQCFRSHAKRHITKREKAVTKKEDIAMTLAVTPYPPEGPIQCSICHKTVLKQCFRSHARTHLERKHACEECGKRFISAHNVRYHQMRMHGKQKRLACTQCEYRAVDSLQLQNHVRAAHTGERPFICDSCGESFRMRYSLVQHMRVHFAVRNVQCDKCPSMFRSSSELSEHKNRYHLYKYSYYCYICPKKFQSSCKTRKHLLKNHGIPRCDQNNTIKYDKIKRI